MMEARSPLGIYHCRCRQAGPYAIYVAGIMKRDAVVPEPHTVVVNPDGHWSIESGWISHQTAVNDLSTTIAAAGLRDSHTHIWGTEFLPSFTMFGVTEVRDLGSPAAVRTQEQILHPDCIHPYPRLIFGGPMLHRRGPTRLVSAVRWDSTSDIHRVLCEAVESEARWQKLYHGFPDNCIPGAIRIAHELGLRVAIHPRLGGARLAVDAGVDEIEHVACLAWDLAEEAATQSSSNLNEHYVHRANQLWATESMRSAPPGRFLSAALCPTLVVQQELLNCARNDFWLPSAPNGLVSEWKRLRVAQPWTTQQLTLGETALENMIRFVGRFVTAGGHLVIGSDTPNPGVMPGRSLWQELDLLHKTDLPPLKLYRRASVYPEGLPDNGDADLAFISLERVMLAAAGGNWGTEPVAGVLLRGCLYEVNVITDRNRCAL